MTFCRRDVTTPGKSGRSTGAAIGAGAIAADGSGTTGGGSGAPHAATAIGRNRFMSLLQWVVLRGFDESGVEAALGEELIVRALLDDAALVHDDDQVRVADRRQAV